MTRQRAWYGLAFALALAGCHSDRPREAPFPSFRMRGVFGESAAKKSAPASDSGEAMLQLPVVLGGRYLATLKVPSMGSEWSWSAHLEGRATLVTHQRAGTPPDVLVYAERGPDEDPMPSVEMRRFLAYADAGSDDLATWALRYALERGLQAIKQSASRSAGGTSSETLLRGLSGGLGFASEAGSFSGWKWVGRTSGTDGSDRVDVRLGRWDGLWTDGKSRLGTALTGLRASGGGGAASSLVALLEGKGVTGSEATDSRPATMIAGSARLPGGAAPVFVALVCARPCSYEADISALFESIRAGTSETLRDAIERGARRDAPEHEKEAGVVLIDTRRAAAEALAAEATGQAAAANAHASTAGAASAAPPASAESTAVPAPSVAATAATSGDGIPR